MAEAGVKYESGGEEHGSDDDILAEGDFILQQKNVLEKIIGMYM
jgi:hypothetical protein